MAPSAARARAPPPDTLEGMYDWLDVGACLVAMALVITCIGALVVGLYEP